MDLCLARIKLAAIAVLDILKYTLQHYCTCGLSQSLFTSQHLCKLVGGNLIQ